MKFYVFVVALEGILLGLASGQFSSLNLQAAVGSSFSAVGGSEVFENENIEVEAGSSILANGQSPLGANVNSPNLQINDLLKLLLNQQQNANTPLTQQQPQNPVANGNFPSQSQQSAIPEASPWNNAAPLLTSNLPQQPYNYPNYPPFHNPSDYFAGIPPDYFPALPSDYYPGGPFPYDYPQNPSYNYPRIPPDYFAGMPFPYNYPQYPSDFSPYDYHPDASFNDAYLPQVVDGKESLNELSKQPLDEKPQEEVEAITIGTHDVTSSKKSNNNLKTASAKEKLKRKNHKNKKKKKHKALSLKSISSSLKTSTPSGSSTSANSIIADIAPEQATSNILNESATEIAVDGTRTVSHTSSPLSSTRSNKNQKKKKLKHKKEKKKLSHKLLSLPSFILPTLGTNAAHEASTTFGSATTLAPILTNFESAVTSTTSEYKAIGTNSGSTGTVPDIKFTTIGGAIIEYTTNSNESKYTTTNSAREFTASDSTIESMTEDIANDSPNGSTSPKSATSTFTSGTTEGFLTTLESDVSPTVSGSLTFTSHISTATFRDLEPPTESLSNEFTTQVTAHESTAEFTPAVTAVKTKSEDIRKASENRIISSEAATKSVLSTTAAKKQERRKLKNKKKKSHKLKISASEISSQSKSMTTEGIVTAAESEVSLITSETLTTLTTDESTVTFISFEPTTERTSIELVTQAATYESTTESTITGSVPTIDIIKSAIEDIKNESINNATNSESPTTSTIGTKNVKKEKTKNVKNKKKKSRKSATLASRTSITPRSTSTDEIITAFKSEVSPTTYETLRTLTTDESITTTFKPSTEFATQAAKYAYTTENTAIESTIADTAPEVISTGTVLAHTNETSATDSLAIDTAPDYTATNAKLQYKTESSIIESSNTDSTSKYKTMDSSNESTTGNTENEFTTATQATHFRESTARSITSESTAESRTVESTSAGIISESTSENIPTAGIIHESTTENLLNASITTFISHESTNRRTTTESTTAGTTFKSIITGTAPSTTEFITTSTNLESEATGTIPESINKSTTTKSTTTGVTLVYATGNTLESINEIKAESTTTGSPTESANAGPMPEYIIESITAESKIIDTTAEFIIENTTVESQTTGTILQSMGFTPESATESSITDSTTAGTSTSTGDPDAKNIETSLFKAALGLAEEISPTVIVENIAGSEEVFSSDTETDEIKKTKGGKKNKKHPKHKRKRNKGRGNVVLQGDSEESTLDTTDATSTTWLYTTVVMAESGSTTQSTSATKSTSESSSTNQSKSTTELVVDKCDVTAGGGCSGESKENGVTRKETEVKGETNSSDGTTTALNSKSTTSATTSQQSLADTVTEEESPDSCRDDQDWWPCAPRCHNTCYNYARGDACEDHDCKSGCFCKDGLLRTDDGDCVDPDDCPSPVCGEHEEETDCISPCNNCAANCYSCPFLSCHEGCDCIDGYKRHDNGTCIHAAMCPPCSSSAPEE